MHCHPLSIRWICDLIHNLSDSSNAQHSLNESASCAYVCKRSFIYKSAYLFVSKRLNISKVRERERETLSVHDHTQQNHSETLNSRHLKTTDMRGKASLRVKFPVSHARMIDVCINGLRCRDFSLFLPLVPLVSVPRVRIHSET